MGVLILISFPAQSRASSLKELEKAKSVNQVQNVLQSFADKYGLRILVGSFEPSGYITRDCTWENVTDEDAADIRRFAKVFLEEWGKYPVEWVKKSNLQGIAFVRQLTVLGQGRAATPDWIGEVLYLDIGYGSAGEVYERGVMHHEYYHIVEETHFKNVYFKDPGWLALNPPDFSYGAGGDTAYEDAEGANAQHPRKGFVTGYAMYAPEEDKAEIYSYLMVTPYYKKLMEWAKTDSALSKKVSYMKKFIKQVSPEMDETYFEKIH